MKILSITAGAGGMYCGSCLRDNALAAELMARGHDVTLLPLYTPLLTDEENVTRPQVLFGGISVYLQQQSAIFRRLPRSVDRLFDSPAVIKFFANRSVSTNPRLLGGMTVSMLEGAGGVLKREFDKLVEWTRDEPAPDIVSLTNSMLIGLAQPLADAFQRPICCTLQGEDLFLESLQEPYKATALGLLRRQVPNVDRFVAVSDYYARFMSRYLQIPSERMSVVPLGINPSGFPPRSFDPARPEAPFTVGFFARVAPEKGLHVLADAYQRFRKQASFPPGAKAAFEVAGYLPSEHKGYLDGVRQSLERAGLGREFTYRGSLDRASKAAFLGGLDVMSVPATYDEPKGISVLEAMACGVPVVQPRRGTYTEMVERTGGGLLIEPGSAEQLADSLHLLYRDPALRQTLGRKGAEGVRAFFTIQRSADRLLEIYARMAARDQPVARRA